MKRMLNLLGILAGLVLGTGCDHTTVGYLDVRNAGYRPDTVYFKAVLNPEDPEEAVAFNLKFPGKPLLLKEYKVHCRFPIK